MNNWDDRFNVEILFTSKEHTEAEYNLTMVSNEVVSASKQLLHEYEDEEYVNRVYGNSDICNVTLGVIVERFNESKRPHTDYMKLSHLFSVYPGDDYTRDPILCFQGRMSTTGGSATVTKAL